MLAFLTTGKIHGLTFTQEKPSRIPIWVIYFCAMVLAYYAVIVWLSAQVLHQAGVPIPDFAYLSSGLSLAETLSGFNAAAFEYSAILQKLDVPFPFLYGGAMIMVLYFHNVKFAIVLPILAIFGDIGENAVIAQAIALSTHQSEFTEVFYQAYTQIKWFAILLSFCVYILVIAFRRMS